MIHSLFSKVSGGSLYQNPGRQILDVLGTVKGNPKNGGEK